MFYFSVQGRFQFWCYCMFYFLKFSLFFIVSWTVTWCSCLLLEQLLLFQEQLCFSEGEVMPVYLYPNLEGLIKVCQVFWCTKIKRVISVYYYLFLVHFPFYYDFLTIDGHLFIAFYIWTYCFKRREKNMSNMIYITSLSFVFALLVQWQVTADLERLNCKCLSWILKVQVHLKSSLISC